MVINLNAKGYFNGMIYKGKILGEKGYPGFRQARLAAD